MHLSIYQQKPFITENPVEKTTEPTTCAYRLMLAKYIFYAVNRALFFLMVIVSPAALAQGSTASNLRKVMPSISFSAGVAHVRTIDEGLSFNGLLFSGTGGMVEIGYQLESSKNFTNFNFQYSGTSLSHSEARIPVSLAHGSLTFSHKRRVGMYKIASKECQLFAGLSLGTSINYFKSSSLDNEDVLVINSIHVTIGNDVRLNELSELNITVAIPTVALAKRLVLDGGLYEPGPDESGTMQILYGDSKLVFANSYVFGASYNRKLSNTVQWLLTYRFKYLQNDNIKSIRLYSNEVSAGLSFNLKK